MSIGPLGSNDGSISSSQGEGNESEKKTAGSLGEHSVSATSSDENLENVEKNVSGTSSDIISSQEQEGVLVEMKHENQHRIDKDNQGGGIKHITGPNGDDYAVVSSTHDDTNKENKDELHTEVKAFLSDEQKEVYDSQRAEYAGATFSSSYVELKNVVSEFQEETSSKVDNEKWKTVGQGIRSAMKSLRESLSGIELKNQIKKSSEKLRNALEKTFQKTGTEDHEEVSSKSCCEKLRNFLKSVREKIRELYKVLVRKSKTLFKDKDLKKVVEETEQEITNMEKNFNKAQLSFQESESILSGLKVRIQSIFLTLRDFLRSLFNKTKNSSVSVATQTTESFPRERSTSLPTTSISEQLLQELKEKLRQRSRSENDIT